MDKLIIERRVVTALTFLTLIAVHGVSHAVDPNPLTDSYSFVNLHTDFDGNKLDNDKFTINGTTNHTYYFDNSDISIPEAVTESFSENTGRAGPGSLGGKVQTDGKGVRFADVEAGFHDVFTVLGSQPVGTTGTMTLVYSISGQTIINYDLFDLGDALNGFQVFPQWDMVFARMSTRIYGPDGNGGAEVIGGQGPPAEQILTIGDLPACTGTPCAISGGSPYNLFTSGAQVTIDVPFVYGEPLPLSTVFFLRVIPDQRFGGQTSSPFKRHWSNHFSELITADFNNTAELMAIVNPGDPTATITAPSGFNYSELVTAESPAPVPVPGAVWLFASAMLGLLGFRQRQQICSS